MLFQTFQMKHLTFLTRSLHISGVMHFKPQPTVEKRAKMLMKLIKNNDKKKHWDLEMGSPTGAPDQSIYDKVHRPHRRASVLNTLFMENITDVLSTGDVCQEVIGSGVEITGVRVTSDYQIVNVYWQIPNVEETANKDIENLLAKNAANIRKEMIKRNVLGKVPRIYFIRDPTNKNAADFAKCLEASGVSKIKDPPSMPVEELMKNLHKFSEARDGSEKKKNLKKQEAPNTVKVNQTAVPETPCDMKFDVMGLNHEQIVNKVLSSRKKLREEPPISSAEVSQEVENCHPTNNNTIYSIPAVPLQNSIDREKLLKKFCTDRKTHWAKVKSQTAITNSADLNEMHMVEEECAERYEDDFLEDFLEDEHYTVIKDHADNPPV